MLTAADVMTADVISVGPDTPVRDIAALLYTHRISGVPVVDETGGVIGIVSEGDLIGHATIVGERRRSWWLSLFADETCRRGLREDARPHRPGRDDHQCGHRRGNRDPRRPRGDFRAAPDQARPGGPRRQARRHRHTGQPAAGLYDAGSGTAQQRGRSSHLREQLLAALEDQPWAHLLDIIVENGVVHLHGTVQTDDERQAFRVAAENMPGVKNVEFHLTPWSSAPIRYSGRDKQELARIHEVSLAKHKQEASLRWKLFAPAWMRSAW